MPSHSGTRATENAGFGRTLSLKVPRRTPPASYSLPPWPCLLSVSFGVQISLTLHKEKSQQAGDTELMGLLTKHIYKDPISK